MRILLVSANRERRPQPVFPIGISYVARALEPDHQVRFHDGIVDGEDSLGPLIREFDPELIGLSLRNVDDTRPTGENQINGYREIVNLIRANSSVPIVLGGSAYTLFPDRYLEELGVEFGIAGEGEHLRLLVDALQNGQDLDALPQDCRIPGLHRPGKPPCPPAYWKGPAGHSRESERLLRQYTPLGGMVSLQTKRGCWMRCCYCTYPIVEGRALRNHPVSDLVDEIESLIAKGAHYLFFVDSVFNLDVDHTSLLAEEMIRRDVRIPWAGYFAPHRTSPEYARLLARSGLTHAEFGTESLSDPVLREYGKPFRVDDVRQAHQALGEAGVHRAHFLLLGGPGETMDTVQQTLANARTLQDTVFFPFATMRIYPGTPLHKRAIAEGVIEPGDPLFDPTFYCSPGVDRDWLNARLAAEAERASNWVLDDSMPGIVDLVARLHAKGRYGPMWEYLIR